MLLASRLRATTIGALLGLGSAAASLAAQDRAHALSAADVVAVHDLVLTEALDSVATYTRGAPRAQVPDSLAAPVHAWWRAQLAAGRVRGLCGALEVRCAPQGWLVRLGRPERRGDSVRVAVSWTRAPERAPSLERAEFAFQQWAVGLFRRRPEPWERHVDYLVRPAGAAGEYVLVRHGAQWRIVQRDRRVLCY